MTPLDFLVVADHAEYLGVVRKLYLEVREGPAAEFAERIRRAIDGGEGARVFAGVLPESVIEPGDTRDPISDVGRDGRRFEDSLSQGDRFLYNRHYVERTPGEVRSHFGDSMAARMLELAPDPQRWQGPVESEHGWHLVLLSDRTESRVPTQSELSDRLREELERERAERALEAGLREVVSRYRVELAPDLDSSAPAPMSTSTPTPKPASKGGETG